MLRAVGVAVGVAVVVAVGVGVGVGVGVAVAVGVGVAVASTSDEAFGAATSASVWEALQPEEIVLDLLEQCVA